MLLFALILKFIFINKIAIQEFLKVMQIFKKKLKEYITNMAVKGDWEFWISDVVRNLMELVFNPCGEFQ